METQKKQNNKKNRLIALVSFLLPAVGMLLIFGAQGIGYGGRLTALTFDLREQYAPFLAGFRYLVEDPRKILFHWNYCLGGNYMGVFAYYLSSPLNWLTLLWKVSDFPDAVYTLILLKIGLCGLTCHFYLSRRYPDKAGWDQVVFSTCYALMSYNVVYYLNIMWTDAVILLPLVLLGVEELLEQKKGGLYCFAIAAVFWTNYYMSYMVGIFAAGYFMIKILTTVNRENYREKLKIVFRFALNTLLALALTMPLLLPACLNVVKGFTGEEKAGFTGRGGLGVSLGWLRKLLPCQFDALAYGDTPYIFCGLLMLGLSVFYFFQKRKKAEKLQYLLLYGMVTAGFFFWPIDLAWHGFRTPNGFTYRYAFLFSWIVLITAYEAWIAIPRQSRVWRYAACLLCVYTLAEIYLNGVVIVGGLQKTNEYTDRETYDEIYALYEPLSAQIKKDAGFYRMGNTGDFNGYNEELMFDVNGMEIFASSIYNDIRCFLVEMGAEDKGRTVGGYGLQPPVNSLLGVKYLISYSALPEVYENTKRSVSPNYESWKLDLYENPEALGLGYMTAADTEVMPQWQRDPFWNQILLMDYLGDVNSGIYEALPYTSQIGSEGDAAEIVMEFEVTSDDAVCCYFDCVVNPDRLITFSLDGEVFAEEYGMGAKKIITMPQMQKGGKHTLRAKGVFQSVDNVYLAVFHPEAYLSDIREIGKRQMYDVGYDGNRIWGKVDAKEGGTLFLTLPYDEGYRVYVDGERTAFQKVLGAFMGIELPAGEHRIRLVYVPPGLPAGVFAMLFGLVGTGVYYCPRRKNAP